jgi:hypothetical protein
LRKANCLLVPFSLAAVGLLASCQEMSTASAPQDAPESAGAAFAARAADVLVAMDSRTNMIRAITGIEPPDPPEVVEMGLRTDRVEYLFDGLVSTEWAPDVARAGINTGAMVEYVVPMAIRKYSVIVQLSPGAVYFGSQPGEWVLQGSNDAAAVVGDPLESARWVKLDSRRLVRSLDWGTAKNDTISFDIAAPSSFVKYRWVVLSDLPLRTHSSRWIEARELVLWARAGDSAGVAVTCNGSFAESMDARMAIDGNTSTIWSSAPGQILSMGSANIQITYPLPVQIHNYSLAGRLGAYRADQLPKSWKLQGSNNGLASAYDPIASSNWETIDSRNGIDIATGWPKTTRTTTTRIFPLASPRTFRSYRLCITENNGSEYTSLIEFDFNR